MDEAKQLPSDLTSPHVIEFDAWPEAGEYSPERGFVYEWKGKATIDLSWVAGATAGILGAGSTEVTIAGSNRRYTIRCDYAEFRDIWMKARNHV